MLRTASFFVRVVLTSLPLASRMLRPYRDLAGGMTGVLGEQARASIKDKTLPKHRGSVA